MRKGNQLLLYYDSNATVVLFIYLSIYLSLREWSTGRVELVKSSNCQASMDDCTESNA